MAKIKRRKRRKQKQIEREKCPKEDNRWWESRPSHKVRWWIIWLFNKKFSHWLHLPSLAILFEDARTMWMWTLITTKVAYERNQMSWSWKTLSIKENQELLSVCQKHQERQNPSDTYKKKMSGSKWFKRSQILVNYFFPVWRERKMKNLGDVELSQSLKAAENLNLGIN